MPSSAGTAKKSAVKTTTAPVAKATAPANKTTAPVKKAKAAATKAPAQKTAPVKKSGGSGPSPAGKIDDRIDELADWRGPMLRRLRQLIHEADPDVVEEWKWEKPSSSGVPVWYHEGGICTGEAYKEVVKLTFFQGASLRDPAKLFNSSLGGNLRRAIDFRQGDAINEKAFKELIRSAVAFNLAKAESKSKAKAESKSKSKGQSGKR